MTIPEDEGAPGAGRAYPVLEDPAEMLFRQVHGNWVEKGVPTSQAFRPMPKDEGMMSIARGSKTTAELAHEHYTRVLGLDSVGTWGLLVAEVEATSPLRAREAELPDDPAHGFVDFRDLPRKVCERLAKILLARAVERGRLHPPA
jgi:hypothetical protein